jgi:hypothetical protein
MKIAASSIRQFDPYFDNNTGEHLIDANVVTDDPSYYAYLIAEAFHPNVILIIIF